MKVYELEEYLSVVPETAEVRFFLDGLDLPIAIRSVHDGLVSEQGILSDQPFHIDLIFEEV